MNGEILRIETAKKLKDQEEEIERLNKNLEAQRHFYLKELEKKENIIKKLKNELNDWYDNCTCEMDNVYFYQQASNILNEESDKEC